MTRDEPSTLEVFDFDWTLFRSPGPGPGIPSKTFIHSPESLGPPHVPLRPGSDFWIEEVVREFRAALRRRDTITVLISARRKNVGPRILELLSQRRLDPNYVFFRAASFQKDKDRFHFKRRMVLDLLEMHPEIDKIVLWEDEEEQMDGIRDLAKRKNIEFEGNLVTESGGLAR